MTQILDCLPNDPIANDEIFQLGTAVVVLQFKNGQQNWSERPTYWANDFLLIMSGEYAECLSIKATLKLQTYWQD